MTRRSRGVSLIELLVVLVVLGILTAVVSPSLADVWNRRRVTAVANEIATDFAFARSEAVARGLNVQLHYKKDAAMSCYTINYRGTEGNCNCLLAGGLACNPAITTSTEVKTVQVNSSLGVSFDSAGWIPGSTGQVEFTFPQYAPTPANFSVTVSGTRGSSLKVQMNALGRISTCSPSGSMPGVPSC